MSIWHMAGWYGTDGYLCMQRMSLSRAPSREMADNNKLEMALSKEAVLCSNYTQIWRPPHECLNCCKLSIYKTNNFLCSFQISWYWLILKSSISMDIFDVYLCLQPLALIDMYTSSILLFLFFFFLPCPAAQNVLHHRSSFLPTQPIGTVCPMTSCWVKKITGVNSGF